MRSRRNKWRSLGARIGGFLTVLVFGLGLGAAATGCVVVKPYQRERLTERCMSPGFGDASELKFRGHWEGSRQGAEGGFGTAGGGCGCN